jgi:hypothetical protein
MDLENHGGRTVFWAILAFSALSLTAMLCSDGFIDADAATHFAYARFALHSPESLVNIWGRPLATGLYMLPAAAAGRLGSRLAALACAIACALIAWRLAILQGYRRPALAAIFTLGQPLLFLHSFNEMTELPFAAVAGFAFWMYRVRCWGWFALAAGLLPMGRPEGFGFCLLAAAALVLHRRPAWLLILLLPTVLWDYSGWTIDMRQGPWWHWLILNWPYAAGSDYGRGPLLHFVMELPVLVSPAALPALWIGAGRSLRRPVDHCSRCQGLIAFIPLTVLIVHSLFHWLGKFSSNGEMRYLLIVAPMWGLLAADGWEWVFERMKWKQPAAWAALALIAPAQINWRIPIVPMHMGPEWYAAQRLVEWYESSPLRKQYPRLLFAHPAVDYYLDRRPDDPVRSTPFSKKALWERLPGYLMMWDQDLSDKNSDPTKDVSIDEALAAGWTPIPTPAGVGPGWRLFLSEPDQ